MWLCMLIAQDFQEAEAMGSLEPKSWGYQLGQDIETLLSK